MTLSLLWEEHRAVHPDGYSRFCELYRRWEGRLSPTMRQHHVAGERMFVDYAGATLEVFDPETGEVWAAQIFVAALGASNYTYAEATWTQSLSDWIGAHCRAFAYFGGVPAQIVSDNLKSGVTKACFYEPAVNRTYAEMAAHGACPRAGGARPGEPGGGSGAAAQAARQGEEPALDLIGGRGRGAGRATLDRIPAPASQYPSRGTRASGTPRRLLPLKERRCSTTRRSTS